ncbi:MAG TPA: caspase family protein [Myxococcota bacterium]|nr:caspase family protein [Myxococcota bacterium]HRY92832.1 caspase family protein [Myxococcota bacterium]HSA20277.1 caspase family protein [Myxococcota bacterium]
MKSLRHTLLVVALLALALPAGAAELYLVSAGNNQGHPGDLPLRYAERDATELAAVLQRLGGVPAQNTVLVLGEDADALRRVVLEQNARIRQQPRQGAVLIVFYSGHADAAGLHLGASTLAFDELNAIMLGSPAAVRLLVLDSCRSGGATRVKGLREAEPFEIRLDDRLQAEGLAIITSSAAGEDSHEADQLRASFFSHHLVNALRGAADSDRDGQITLDEAYRYTYQQTLRSSGRTMQLQHPTYQYDIKGKGELVLSRLTHDRNRSGRLSLGEAGFYLVLEQEEGGPVAAEVAVEAGGARLVLPAGRYFVQRRTPDHYLEYRVELQAGQELELSAQDGRRVEYARLLRKGGGESEVEASVFAYGAARGEVLGGEAVAPGALVGVSLDLPWLSLGLRLRWARSALDSADGLVSSTQDELAVGLSAVRVIDLPYVSLSVGLLVEGAWHTQAFETLGRAGDRSSWSFGFGALAGLDVPLGAGLELRIEAGPVAWVFDQALLEGGAVTGAETRAAITWWAAGGLAWRL